MTPPKLREFEERFGLPKLTDVTTFLSGDNGKRINSIITKLDRLSQNREALVEAIRLLELVREMGSSGDLERLDSILEALPKGKSGQSMLVEVRKLVSELSEKLDKLSNLATTLLGKED